MPLVDMADFFNNLKLSFSSILVFKGIYLVFSYIFKSGSSQRKNKQSKTILCQVLVSATKFKNKK